MNELTVATLNCSNLTLSGGRRLEFVARTIRRSGCHVVCLQEVWQREPVLERLQSEYLPEFSERVQWPGNDSRGMGLALLSRLPVLDSCSHIDLRFPHPTRPGASSAFSRDVVRVDVQCWGERWSLYNLHLKSMRGGESAGLQRWAEVEALLGLLEGEQQGRRPHLLLGDFNDGRHSSVVERLHERYENSLEQATFPVKGPRHQFDYVLMPPELKPRLLHSRTWFESRASDHALLSATFCPPASAPLSIPSDRPE